MGEVTRLAMLVVDRVMAENREGEDSDLWKQMQDWSERKLTQWMKDNSR